MEFVVFYLFLLGLVCFLPFLTVILTSGESSTDILFIGKKISITFLGNNLMLRIRGFKTFMLFISLSKSMQKKSYDQSTEMFTTLLVIKRKDLIFCSKMVL